jgi:hypothetical protein
LITISVFHSLCVLLIGCWHAVLPAAVQVVERHWYERNKHIFPASRWEIFDPEADYGE